MNILTEIWKSIDVGLEQGLYQLGSLCHQQHDYKETGKSPRYKGNCVSCVVCNKMKNREKSHQKWIERKSLQSNNREKARKGKGFILRIYGLKVQGEKDYFYIGRTSCSLSERLRGHLKSSQTSLSPKSIKIKQNIDHNKKIEIILLHEKIVYSRQEAETLEQSWIDWVGMTSTLMNSVSAEKGCVFGEHGKSIPQEIIDKMGTVPDSVIAEMLNCTSSNVYQIRKKKGIKGYDAYHEWSEDEVLLLGTKSDPEIAQELNLTRAIVQKKRISLGIPACPQFPYVWSEDIMSRLGTVPDSVIAKEMGMSHWAMVQKKRKQLGIPSFRQNARTKIAQDCHQKLKN